MLFVGIDPGASGGLAVLSDAGSVGMKPLGGLTDRDLWDWVLSVANDPARLRKPGGVFAVVEKVGGYLRTKAPQPGSTMFNFGKGVGKLVMALTAAGVPYEEATPQQWQRVLGVTPRGKDEGNTAWKNRLKGHAQRLFPKVTVTLAVADALLIAEFCRRVRSGEATRRQKTGAVKAK